MFGISYGFSLMAYEPGPDSVPPIDDDPTPPSEWPVMPDEVLPAVPCAICGLDVCEHDRAARED